MSLLWLWYYGLVLQLDCLCLITNLPEKNEPYLLILHEGKILFSILNWFYPVYQRWLTSQMSPSPPMSPDRGGSWPQSGFGDTSTRFSQTCARRHRDQFGASSLDFYWGDTEMLSSWTFCSYWALGSCCFNRSRITILLLLIWTAFFWARRIYDHKCYLMDQDRCFWDQSIL